MATKTKKIKAAGRFGVGYGLKIRKKLNEIESKQRKKQTCPFCKRQPVKRLARGIWKCSKCNKTFASDVFFIPPKT